MAERNRVTPFGEVVAIDQRGRFLGNRGCIHRGHEVVRPWQGRRWITCALRYRGWVAPKWAAGRYTALFFWDEAVALAAGHRPCALCRRPDVDRWMDGWEAATGRRPTVEAVDRQLHEERTDGRAKRVHRRPWPSLPAGSYVAVDGDPLLVLADCLVPWTPAPDGYGPAVARPVRGDVDLLTPPSTVAVLAAGYQPELAPVGSNR